MYGLCGCICCTWSIFDWTWTILQGKTVHCTWKSFNACMPPSQSSPWAVRPYCLSRLCWVACIIMYLGCQKMWHLCPDTEKKWPDLWCHLLVFMERWLMLHGYTQESIMIPDVLYVYLNCLDPQDRSLSGPTLGSQLSRLENRICSRHLRMILDPLSFLHLRLRHGPNWLGKLGSSWSFTWDLLDLKRTIDENCQIR